MDTCTGASGGMPTSTKVASSDPAASSASTGSVLKRPRTMASASSAASASVAAAAAAAAAAAPAAKKSRASATASGGGSTSAKTEKNKSKDAGGAKSVGETKTKKAGPKDGYEPLTLQQIQARVNDLCDRVPRVPPGDGLDPKDKQAVREWATAMQTVIEEFNLLLCCVSASTYKWGSERSGAADQNLGVLSAELGNAQEQITSSVTPKLTNVLAPVVDLVIERTVVTKRKISDSKEGENGADNDADVETRVNYFSREKVDPDFLDLCHTILCRNIPMLRQVVLANFHKIDKVIGDYLKATKKDNQHDRGFAY